MANISDRQRGQAFEQLEKYRTMFKFDSCSLTIERLSEAYNYCKYFPLFKQNLNNWTQEQKGYFIESLLLGVPAKDLVFCESPNNHYDIIDGHQRCLAIYEFLNNELILNNLTTLTVLNGFSFADLPEAYRNKFKSTKINVFILSSNMSREFMYEFLCRINANCSENFDLDSSSLRENSCLGDVFDPKDFPSLGD